MSSVEYSKYNEIKKEKKIDGSHGSRITPGGSPFSPPPEKVSKTPLKLRIASVAPAVGFGMLIGGAIAGAVPLVIIVLL